MVYARRSLHGLDEDADFDPEGARTQPPPQAPPSQAQPLRADHATGGMQRRRSSIVAPRSDDHPDALSVLESAGADVSLRPRFLKERSVTLAQLAGAAEPPLAVVPQSKAGAFLLSVMAKARGNMLYDQRRVPFDPHRGPTTNSLSYSNHKKEHGVPLRLASGPSRRLGLFVGGASSSSRLLLSDDISKAPATAGAEAEVVREDKQRSMAALVQELGAHRQQIHRQMDTLHEMLQYLTEAEHDRVVQAQLCEELSDAGFVLEIISSLREFRFHLGLQVLCLCLSHSLALSLLVSSVGRSSLTLCSHCALNILLLLLRQMCAMTILSTLADHSNLYAYAMGEVRAAASGRSPSELCRRCLILLFLPCQDRATWSFSYRKPGACTGPMSGSWSWPARCCMRLTSPRPPPMPARTKKARR